MEVNINSNNVTNGTSTNVSGNNGFDFHTKFQVPTIIYISLIIQMVLLITIFFGNSLVIILIARFHKLHSISNFFIACLSGADIGLSFAMIPGVVFTYNPLFGASKLKCLLLWCSIMFSSLTSCFTLLVVTFDRYLQITRPMLYPSLMTYRKALIIMGAVWVYTFFFTIILPFAGVNQIFNKSSFICFEFTDVFSSLYLHIYFYIHGLIPFLVMCIMYGAILKIILEKLRSTNQVAPVVQSANTNDTSHSKRWFRKELKSVKTLIIILGFTGFAWLPSTIIYLKHIYNPSYIPGWELRSYVSWLTYLNSSVNPIVYAFRSKLFREAAYDLFCKNRFVLDINILRQPRNPPVVSSSNINSNLTDSTVITNNIC